MTPVFGRDDLVAKWVGANLGQVIVPPFVAIGFTEDGTSLCGGAVFNEWNGSNVEVTIYGPGALRRSAIQTVLRYAFRQIKANRLTARTKRSNRVMRRLLPRLGFRFECSMKHYYGPSRGEDALMFVLLPADAGKWI